MTLDEMLDELTQYHTHWELVWGGDSEWHCTDSTDEGLAGKLDITVYAKDKKDAVFGALKRARRADELIKCCWCDHAQLPEDITRCERGHGQCVRCYAGHKECVRCGFVCDICDVSEDTMDCDECDNKVCDKCSNGEIQHRICNDCKHDNAIEEG